MKVFYPKNISWGRFSLSFPIWPFKVTLAQLLIIAAGAAISLAIWQWVNKSWANQLLGIMLSVPVMIIFLVIAFFEISEMNLAQFITKIIRTNVLDESIKYQTNAERIDPNDIIIKKIKAHIQDSERTISDDKSAERISSDQLKKIDILTQMVNTENIKK